MSGFSVVTRGIRGKGMHRITTFMNDSEWRVGEVVHRLNSYSRDSFSDGIFHYVNGKCHCITGPACISPYYNSYWIGGVCYSKSAYERIMKINAKT